MTKWRKLSEYAYFVKDRIEVKKLTHDNYISTENMLANKGGIKSSSSLPNIKTVIRFNKDDILISNIRLYFKKIYIAKFKGGASNDVLVLRIDKGNSPEYIYYALSDNNFFNYAHTTSKGTKMPRGDKNSIMKYPIRNVSLKTQEKIAKVLSTYDELIENNNRRIELLEQMAEEIYKEWFVRMRFPGYEETKFEKGIPEGWEIDYFINDNVKLISSGIDKFDGNKIYLATADVDGIGIVGGEEITHTDRPSRANMQPKKGSIWFAKMQDTVKHLYFDNFSEDRISKLILSTGFAGIKFKNMNYFYYYLSFIRHGVFENIKDMYANGSTQVAINNKNIKRLKLIIPSEDLLLNFNNKLENIYFIIQKYKEQNQNLIKQRDMLLPRLMNGTIEVE